jgi:hypothetical protein
MILTPIPADALPEMLGRFMSELRDEPARQAFARIASPEDAKRACGSTAVRDQGRALAIAAKQGIATRPGSPALDFSWNGESLRADTEAYVLLHEVAHFQLAAPARRQVIDFGLGAGPETGNRATADSAACLFGIDREHEEALASLLGILWEVELGQPALASLLDQNWLEGTGHPGAARHFETILGELRAGGFIDAALRPTRRLRDEPDPLRCSAYSLTAPVRLET